MTLLCTLNNLFSLLSNFRKGDGFESTIHILTDDNKLIEHIVQWLCKWQQCEFIISDLYLELSLPSVTSTCFCTTSQWQPLGDITAENTVSFGPRQVVTFM